MTTTIDQILKTAILAENDQATVVAMRALRRKLPSAGLDPHTIRVNPPSRATASLRQLAEREIEIEHLKAIVASRDADIEVLRADLAARTNELNGEIYRLLAEIDTMVQHERPDPVARQRTEYVNRLSYSPIEAVEARARIARDVEAGIITSMQGRRFKAWVTRRTDPNKVCDPVNLPAVVV